MNNRPRTALRIAKAWWSQWTSRFEPEATTESFRSYGALDPGGSWGRTVSAAWKPSSTPRSKKINDSGTQAQPKLRALRTTAAGVSATSSTRASRTGDSSIVERLKVGSVGAGAPDT